VVPLNSAAPLLAIPTSSLTLLKDASCTPYPVLMAIVSVAPVLLDWEYVVNVGAIDSRLTIAPEEFAVTPMAERFVSAFTAAAIPEAIVVRVSDDRTVSHGCFFSLQCEFLLRRIFDNGILLQFGTLTAKCVKFFPAFENQVLSMICKSGMTGSSDKVGDA
jgi:hypothetical protein